MKQVLLELDAYGSKLFVLPPRVAMRIAAILSRAAISYEGEGIYKSKDIDVKVLFKPFTMHKLEIIAPIELPEQEYSMINEF
jgi:hypothetical protein